MAPECLRNPAAVSDKSDVYSFAIILYEMHSRAGPFGDIELSEVEILREVYFMSPLCKLINESLDGRDYLPS